MLYLPPLQFISHGDATETLTQIERALAMGARFVQVRMKESNPEKIASVIEQAITLCNKNGALLIVDDHVDIAHLCNGVHLGRNDMPPDQARKILGLQVIIGATVNSQEDIDNLIGNSNSFNYIGLGPWSFTSTKSNLAPTLGPEGTKVLIKRIRQLWPGVPVYSIGGIVPDDVPSILASGADGVAISARMLEHIPQFIDKLKDRPKLLNQHFENIQAHN